MMMHLMLGVRDVTAPEKNCRQSFDAWPSPGPYFIVMEVVVSNAFFVAHTIIRRSCMPVVQYVRGVRLSPVVFRLRHNVT